MRKLLFKNSDNITRATYLYNSFGPPNAMPLVAKRAPALLGKDFYETVKIDFKIRNLENGYTSIFMYLSGEKLSEKTKAECEEITRKLEKAIYIPKEYNAKLLKEVENKFKELYTGMEARLADEIKDMFGFGLPIYTTIAISGAFYTDGKHCSGSHLFSTPDNLFITLEVSYNIDMKRDMDTLFSVFIHELLHGLMGQKGLRIKRDGDYFEEALLDYFAPYGLLAQKLGLARVESAEKCYSVNIRNRPYSRTMGQRLLPYMKEYYKGHDSTVWRYLAKRGFKKYIKTVF
jgi:hypothetical protein